MLKKKILQIITIKSTKEHICIYISVYNTLMYIIHAPAKTCPRPIHYLFGIWLVYGINDERNIQNNRDATGGSATRHAAWPKVFVRLAPTWRQQRFVSRDPRAVARGICV